MQKTYTLYFCNGLERLHFEPLLCRSDAEAMTRARERLAGGGEHEFVEVYFGDHLLFRLTRSRSPPDQDGPV